MIIIEGKPQYDAVCAWMHEALICCGVCLRSPLCSWQWRSSGPSAGAPWWIWYVIGGDTGCYTPAPPACECVCLCLCAYERWRSWKFPPACLPACVTSRPWSGAVGATVRKDFETFCCFELHRRLLFPIQSALLLIENNLLRVMYQDVYITTFSEKVRMKWSKVK